MRGYTGSKTKAEIKDLWQTPKFVFDYYNNRFGFGVDLAASDDNKLCETYFTEENSAFDSFTEMYGANVWANPPYSDVDAWIDLCIKISKESRVLVVMLLNADTSVKWFGKAFTECSECHLITGRLSFINAETGKPAPGNSKGQVVFVFDPNSPFKSQTVLVDRDSMKV